MCPVPLPLPLHCPGCPPVHRDLLSDFRKPSQILGTLPIPAFWACGQEPADCVEGGRWWVWSPVQAVRARRP